ncbi:MAG: DUF4331 family protein [Acidobacteria bacterium]|nr:DUF4331 family protein [Acidobacteriota bacterium]
MLRLRTQTQKLAAFALSISLALTLLLIPATPVGAADHGDSPSASLDRSADINDIYLFLDPSDNSRVVLLATVAGFIVPSEAVNFGVFDPAVRYRFELETNGDAVPDQFIDVTFSEKVGTSSSAQTASVNSTFLQTFTAPTTVPTLNATAPTPVVTTDASTGISFFAGVVDDPFFFDIPGFQRFVASVGAGSPNPAALQRGRDSFAGYNTLAIGLSMPIALLRARTGLTGNSLGLAYRTSRRATVTGVLPSRFPRTTYLDVDRTGNPAVNVALIPFARKNEYNAASPIDDALGRFAGSIVATLTSLGTNATNIGILASVAVTRGDYLRFDLTKANSGPGGGNNAGASFPNGRRLGDDVIDTILFFVANQNAFGDNVNSNDVPLRDTFPFFGAPQQPRDSGTDDNTRN